MVQGQHVRENISSRSGGTRKTNDSLSQPIWDGGSRTERGRNTRGNSGKTKISRRGNGTQCYCPLSLTYFRESYFCAPKGESVFPFETSETFHQTTRRHIAEHDIIHSHHLHNFKSHSLVSLRKVGIRTGLGVGTRQHCTDETEELSYQMNY